MDQLLWPFRTEYNIEIIVHMENYFVTYPSKPQTFTIKGFCTITQSGPIIRRPIEQLT
jgi:hypothetical protein